MDTKGIAAPAATLHSASDDWHLAVLIPACDEEALLPRCLQSIAASRAMLPAGVTSDVIVVVDSSTDRSFALARAIVGDEGLVLEANERCVGRARALAAHAALGRHHRPPARCWLANTDADCCVPPSWLKDHLHAACDGYAAAAGIIDVVDFSEHLPQVEERFRQTYRIHDDGTHPHVHGANLGVRLDAYLAAGGWGDLTTAEDGDLWRRLAAGGGRLLSDAGLRVVTSGRRTGRAPMGFAAALGRHNEPVSA